MLIHIVTCTLVLAVSFANAQSSCKTPNNKNGKCIGLYECDPLLNILYKKEKTNEDISFLRNSQCGQQDQTPLVCCQPSDCMTPENKPGYCIDLYQCPHMVDLLADAKNIRNINFVQNSVCQGPAEYNVCCGPTPSPEKPITSTSKPSPTFYNQCSKTLTAFPPARNSNCCGRDANSRNKIVGGEEAWIDEYPWLVIIEYTDLDRIRLLCGGSLISTKYVLTAGHCVRGRILEKGIPTNVRLGEYNTTFNGEDCRPIEAGGIDCTDPVIITPIEKIIPHPEYRPYSFQRRHDIALLRLRDAAPYTDFIRPVCLPSRDYTKSQPSPFELFAAGWGRYIQFDNGKGLSSPIKRHVQLPYVDQSNCQAAQRTLKNGENITLWNGQLCAGGVPGKDSCKGDSGGPLMYKDQRTFEIIGIVSYGPEKCGEQNIPGVYTNVYEYLPWITSVIEA